MKKVFYFIAIVLFVLGCTPEHSKNEVSLSNNEALVNYLEQAKNETRSRQERLDFTQKALALALASQDENDSLTINNLFEIANQYYNIDAMNEYKKSVQLIASRLEKTNDKVNLAKVYEYLGDYYLYLSVKDSAYFHYIKAEKEYTKLNNLKGVGQIQLNRAILLYKDGDFRRSEIYCWEAQKNFVDVKDIDQRKIYEIYNLLGILAREQQKYDDALLYYNKALNHLNENHITDNELLKSICLNNIGFVYQSNGDNNKALSQFQKALQNTSLQEEVPFLYAMLLDNTAYSRFKLNQTTGVPDLFYQALRIREALDIVPGIVINKVHLSEYYQSQKDNTKALAFAQQAYTLAKTKGTDPNDVMLALKQLQAVDPAQKTIYTASYNHIADSLKQKRPELHQNMVNAFAKIETLTIEKAALEKEKMLITTWSSVAVIFLMLAIGLISLRFKNQKLESEKIEQVANKHIYNLMLDQEVKTKTVSINLQKKIEDRLSNYIITKLATARLLLESMNYRSDEKTIKQRQTCFFALRHLENELIEIQKKLVKQINPDFGKDSFITLVEDFVKTETSLSKIVVDTCYVDSSVNWQNIDTTTKTKLYRTIQTFFETANKTDYKIAVAITILGVGNKLELLIQDDENYQDTNKKVKKLQINTDADISVLYNVKREANKYVEMVLSLEMEREIV